MVADNLRGGYGLATTYARVSDYDKLEKALMSGLPNEVDFVINVCTLLSNESKHTLRLDRCAVLTDLLLAHIGIFDEGKEFRILAVALLIVVTCQQIAYFPFEGVVVVFDLYEL